MVKILAVSKQANRTIATRRTHQRVPEHTQTVLTFPVVWTLLSVPTVGWSQCTVVLDHKIKLQLNNKNV
jgi:hypothetical protein